MSVREARDFALTLQLGVFAPSSSWSIDHLQNALNRISSWITANPPTLNSSNTEFLLTGLSKHLAKSHNSSINTTHSDWNISFIFDKHLTFSDQISSVSKSCYYCSCQLRCIRHYLNTKTASTIATSIVHSKLDYCNSLNYNLPKSQITRLQQIENSLARAVVKCQSSQIQSHHSHPLVYALVKDNWAHWIQAPLTYLQSSHNHPTFISA